MKGGNRVVGVDGMGFVETNRHTRVRSLPLRSCIQHGNVRRREYPTTEKIGVRKRKERKKKNTLEIGRRLKETSTRGVVESNRRKRQRAGTKDVARGMVVSYLHDDTSYDPAMTRRPGTGNLERETIHEAGWRA